MTDTAELIHRSVIDQRALDIIYRHCWMSDLPDRPNAAILLMALHDYGWELRWTRALNEDRPIGMRGSAEERIRQYREGPSPIGPPPDLKGPGPEWNRP